MLWVSGTRFALLEKINATLIDQIKSVSTRSFLQIWELNRTTTQLTAIASRCDVPRDLPSNFNQNDQKHRSSPKINVTFQSTATIRTNLTPDRDLRFALLILLDRGTYLPTCAFASAFQQPFSSVISNCARHRFQTNDIYDANQHHHGTEPPSKKTHKREPWGQQAAEQ